jgi:chromosome segregation ATPase
VEVVKVDNPYKDYKEIKRDDITIDTEVPKLPERPNILTKDLKEEKINNIDTKILELKNKKLSLTNKQSELTATLKRQKPQTIKDAELKRKKLIEEKSSHLKTLKDLNLEKENIKEKINSFDNQKPEKLKKKQNQPEGNLPQDEEELNKMLA